MEAGILDKNRGEKKLQYLNIVEENLLKQLNQIEKNKTNELKETNTQTNTENESDDEEEEVNLTRLFSLKPLIIKKGKFTWHYYGNLKNN